MEELTIARILKNCRKYFYEISPSEKEIMCSYFKDREVYDIYNIVRVTNKNTSGFDHNIIEKLLARIKCNLIDTKHSASMQEYYYQVVN